MKDTAEFYLNGKTRLASLGTSMRFNKGDLINIRGTTYKVIRVTFALDYIDLGPTHSETRQHVSLEKVPKK